MNIVSMHLLDLLIVGFVGAGVARGVTTGYAQQLLDVLAVVIALGCALVVMNPVSDLFTAFRKPFDEGQVMAVSFCITFVFVFFLCFTLLRLRRTTNPEAQSWAHRFVGGACGLLLTVLLLSTTFTALAQADEPAPMTRHQSLLYEPVASSMPAMWLATSSVIPLDPLPAYFEKRRIEMPKSAEELD